MAEKSAASQFKRGGLRDQPVAIIGMASIMPNAHNLEEYWNNILQKIDCIIEVPADRWKVEDYYDPDPTRPDKIYCKRGGFIPDIEFDPMEFGLPPNILEVTDVAQLLTLLVARDALEDAGYGESREWDRELTGVILGLVGMSMKTFMPLMNRLQYPVWEKVLKSAGISDADTQVIVEKIKKAYINWEENAFPGTLANVVAGRVANRFDLGGTTAVTDAACASSMAAFKMAVMELVEGRADMMLAGGVDTDNSISSYISFSKTPAFTRNGVVRAFDADSAGMMVGEGIGIVVLKRLADAERDGDRIYAVIRGIGSSSDGRFKSIYAPHAAGQAKALRRAYAEAGYSPATVGLIEAHGTGTMAGDPAEVEGLKSVFGEDNPDFQYIALGSVKSQIGHTKATAGAASLIKTVLALYNKVLPPTLNVTHPNPKLELETSPFYLNTETRPWFRHSPETPRRAGVSSFGFGGTNYHLTLEEYSADHQKPYRFNQIAHPILFFAADSGALLALCSSTLNGLQGEGSPAFFNDLAASSRKAKIPSTSSRLGFVAEDAQEAVIILQAAIQALQAQPEAEAWDNTKGAFFRKSGIDPSGKVVALFPGQGSQYLEMGKELAMNFPTVRLSFECMDEHFRRKNGSTLTGTVFPRPVFDPKEREALEKKLQQTENAQPAIGTLSLALFTLLQQAGFQMDFSAGHSFGEWTALWAAGVLSEEDYLAAAFARGQAMAAPDDPSFDAGTMLAVKGDIARVKEEIASFPEITLANHNSNSQVVLAGSKTEIARIQQVLSAKGFSVVQLPVSAAFHTKLVGHAQKPFAQALKGLTFKKPSVKVFSNSTGKGHSVDPEAIRAVMVDHILNPVLFKDEIETIYEAGGRVFVEIGPKNILTNLVDSILGARPHFCVALNGSAKKDSDRQLREAAVRLQVIGLELGDIDPFALPVKKLPAKKKSAVTVKLNGGLYMSDKTRKAFDNALQDGWKISQAEPKVVIQEVEKVVKVPVPSAASQPTESTSGLAALDLVMGRLETFQRETLKVHELYLQNQAEYGKIFAQLTQAELGVITNNPNQTGLQALESLERSMQRFHDHQAETLRIHQQYLANQEELGKSLFNLAQAQLSSTATGQAAAHPTTSHQVVAASPAITESPKPASPPVVQKAKTADDNGSYSLKPVTAPVLPVQDSTPTPQAPAVSTRISSLDDYKTALLKVVSEKTGYPQEMFDLAMDMEADLGIDSIKRVEILGAIQLQFPQMSKPEPEMLAELRNLQQILNFMTASMGSGSTLEVVETNPQPVIEQKLTLAPESTMVDPVPALLKIVSEKTGYPQEMLDMGMDMEADLGIDSIKRVEILGAVQQLFPQLPQPEPETLAEMRTLRHVVEYMRSGNANLKVESTPSAQPVPAGTAHLSLLPLAVELSPATPVTSPEEITASLLKVVSEKTGYPQEMLELGMDMEADLGIDSIKRVEILGGIQQVFPGLPKPEPETLAEQRTLQQVIDFLSKSAAAETAVEVQRPFV